MFTVIFGRPGCPYCVRAKELAEKLTKSAMTSTSAMWISMRKAAKPIWKNRG
jgi:glutaredoxin